MMVIPQTKAVNMVMERGMDLRSFRGRFVMDWMCRSERETLKLTSQVSGLEGKVVSFFLKIFLNIIVFLCL